MREGSARYEEDDTPATEGFGITGRLRPGNLLTLNREGSVARHPRLVVQVGARLCRSRPGHRPEVGFLIGLG